MAARFFGQFVLQKGLVSEEQLTRALEIQQSANVKLGTRAIDAGLMTSQEVERVNLLQRSQDRRFGELAVESGAISEEQLRELLTIQSAERLYLGEALVKIGALDSQQLARELESFHGEHGAKPASLTEMYAGLPNAKALASCTDVTMKMFLRILHTPVKPAPCYSERSGLSECAYTIAQRFKGDFDAYLCLNVSSTFLTFIAGRLLEDDIRVVDEDTLDAAGEFINIIAGNVCEQLSGAGQRVELEPPIVHDWSLGAFNSAAGRSTITPLSHPSETIELWVMESLLT